MANDLEQKARELLEFERHKPTENTGIVCYSAALRAIAAALQAQQPRGSRLTAYDGLTEQFCDEVARLADDAPGIHDAVRGALASCDASIVPNCGQQPGAQAVAIVGDDLYPGWVDDAPDLPPGTKLYTAPPPLPEGVSEEDAKAALAAMDAVLVELTGLYGVEKLSDDHQAELLQGIRAALENFLARLAAKGGAV